MNADIAQTICHSLFHTEIVNWSKTCKTMYDMLKNVSFHRWTCLWKINEKYQKGSSSLLKKFYHHRDANHQSNVWIDIENINVFVLNKIRYAFITHENLFPVLSHLTQCEKLVIDTYIFFSNDETKINALPASLRSLNMDIYSCNLCESLFGPALEKLHICLDDDNEINIRLQTNQSFGWSRHDLDLIFYIPQNILTLAFVGYGYTFLTFDLILPHLKKLCLHTIENINLSLFENLEYLRLHSLPNHYDQWPSKLSTLKLKVLTNVNLIPIQIQHLNVRLCTHNHQTFEHLSHLKTLKITTLKPISHLPISLIHLTIKNCNTINIELPHQLQRLIAPQSKLKENIALPTSLTHLHLQTYHDPLPPHLRVLCLEKLILQGNLPSQLQVLHVKHYDTYIDHWPSTLKCIYLPDYDYAIPWTTLHNLRSVIVHQNYTY